SNQISVIRYQRSGTCSPSQIVIPTVGPRRVRAVVEGSWQDRGFPRHGVCAWVLGLRVPQVRFITWVLGFSFLSSLCPLCSDLCDLCVTVPLLFASLSLISAILSHSAWNCGLLTVNCELSMPHADRIAALEAIIYAADEPATLDQLAAVLGEEKLVVQSALDELVAAYAFDERGIEVRAVAGGYKMYTKPQHHDVVRRYIKSLRPPLRLSMPALETLAVIAYKQPDPAPEISDIRGVNASGVISTLLDKKLITTAGRKEVLGRPILYKTSKEFLMRFGL